jgi:multiple sugar transport system permease protein
MKKNKGMIIAFLTPALIFFAAVFVYPILRTLLMSFFNIEGVTDSIDKWSFAGISNYISLMQTALFRTAMLNMLKIQCH